MSHCGGHGHHDCEGGSSHDPAEMGISYSLYKKIDLENVQCLNEAVENSGRLVFKPWEERLSLDKVGFFMLFTSLQVLKDISIKLIKKISLIIFLFVKYINILKNKPV